MLTTQPEEVIQKLLIYCDLSIQKPCFNPHLSKRAINTASSIQAIKKIYTGSSDNWKNYREFIFPKILDLT